MVIFLMVWFVLTLVSHNLTFFSVRYPCALRVPWTVAKVPHQIELEIPCEPPHAP